jgi:hypothetical protein
MSESFTPEEYKIAEMVVEYIRICRESGAAERHWQGGTNGLPSKADIWHSALLNRLKSGKRIFKVPPPKAHSYPWYDIIDEGAWYFHSDYETDMYYYPAEEDEPTYVIRQSRWKILDRDPLTISWTGKDRWVFEDAEPGHLSGVTAKTGKGWLKVFADRVLRRIDDEDIW